MCAGPRCGIGSLRLCDWERNDDANVGQEFVGEKMPTKPLHERQILRMEKLKMRLLKINLLAFALVLLSVSVASAITIRLENTANPNQVAAYLDMDAEAGTQVGTINIGIDSLDSALTYVGAEPAPTLIQVGGQPGIMLSFGFAWLKPTVGR